MKALLAFILTVAVLAVSGQSRIEVVSESYSSGKPKVIRSFNSKEEVIDSLEVYNYLGHRYLSRPATFSVLGYYENGQLQYSGQYKGGLAYGKWVTLYEDGTLNSRSYYKDGKLADSLLCWHPSGVVSRLSVEVNPAKDYWHNIDYYESGNKLMECYQVLLADKWLVEGSYREWYDTKQLGLQATVKKGWAVGKWRMWDEEGQLIKESEEAFEVK